MRKSNIQRETYETKINIDLNIDGTGVSNINTGIGFLDHMLILMSKHGRFDLDVQCTGDLHIDNHHTVEDIGIAMGKAFKKAMGDKYGIKRYGSAFTPMDEALSLCALDLSGRFFLVFDHQFKSERVGTFETETLKEFLYAFADNAQITLNIQIITGTNTHHIIESIFKGMGRSLKEALTIDPTINGVMSTKGCL